MQKTKKRTRELLIMVLLILVSGSPVLNTPILFGVLGLVSLYYSLIRTNCKIRTKLWLYIAFLLLVFVGQYFTLGTISYLGSINVIMKIVFGATVMWVLKERFRFVYLEVMYYFALISLVLFTLGLVGVIIPNVFPTTEVRHSILIYNALVQGDGLGRNCGPFWEPGAYACYLVLIPLLFFDNLNVLIHSYKKHTLVLLVALVSTFSTTGYICLAVLLLFYVLKDSKHKILSYVFLLPLVIGGIVYAYTSLDFLGAKVNEQFVDSQGQYGEFSSTRVGSLLFDLYYIEKHPMFGNGLIEQTRYADHRHLWGMNLGHGNGFSNYIAQMGLVAMFVYLLLLYKNVKGNSFSKWGVVLVVILLLQGEQLLNYPLFLSLPFVIYSNSHCHKNINSNIKEQYEKNSSNFNRL